MFAFVYPAPLNHGRYGLSNKLLTVIPGHGPAAIGEAADWDKLLAYLTTVREEIRIVINDLGTIEEATVTVGLSERQNWELFDQYHRRNVTAAFVELEWE